MYDNSGIIQDLGLFLWSKSKFWLWQASLKKFNPLIFPGGVQTTGYTGILLSIFPI
jgi:hypothetical protein